MQIDLKRITQIALMMLIGMACEEPFDKQAALRAAVFAIEETLNPVDAVFMYKVIELTGEIADMAERVGRRLELLLSH